MCRAIRPAGRVLLALLTCGPAAPVFAQDAGRTAPLIDAPGSAETAALCTACHYAAQFAGERLDHTDWAFVMSTMASEYGMPEPDETLRQRPISAPTSAPTPAAEAWIRT